MRSRGPDIGDERAESGFLACEGIRILYDNAKQVKMRNKMSDTIFQGVLCNVEHRQ